MGCKTQHHEMLVFQSSQLVHGAHVLSLQVHQCPRSYPTICWCTFSTSFQSSKQTVAFRNSLWFLQTLDSVTTSDNALAGISNLTKARTISLWVWNSCFSPSDFWVYFGRHRYVIPSDHSDSMVTHCKNNFEGGFATVLNTVDSLCSPTVILVLSFFLAIR